MLETGSVLTDYSENNVASDENNETLKERHLIPITTVDEDSDSDDIIYRINITEHLANIINQNSDEDAREQNVKLAISVTEDISITRFSDLFDPAEQFVNQGSLLSFKTVPLHGSSSNDIDKRPRLIIKFTETN